MELFRIAQEKFATDLSGNGARLYGGRWNSEGMFAVYTSASRALALLETLAHTPAKMLEVQSYVLITLYVPDTIKPVQMDIDNFPKGWDAAGVQPFTRNKGDQFLRDKKSLIMVVPSVLVPEEFNYVINPIHTAMKRIKISHKRIIQFDKRVAHGAF
ncbi:MAG TPA: RES family NAD+ phosphorylase [Chitinophagaceae bacterium]|jgi:RES domain-containing protein|nr:RES family NAD+ phosphorylase [Chitinophagaceae bacterium]OPZ18633.1 MAG: RES domain protein [Bacteroidetes bacterium ADurb.BinA245]HMW65957.1 RES family NAD+ phosphorylase [Chitinophagaceae bacterium]HMX77685.1 RES family NAD+ phosphorylase [Chitinophagaceae bacterium]HNA18648.1 RES family NAD+ phosphorylase [Chitinophagaceae bacterium]